MNRSVRADLPGSRYVLAVVTADTAKTLARRVANEDQSMFGLTDVATSAQVSFKPADVLILSIVDAPGGTFNHDHPVHIR